MAKKLIPDELDIELSKPITLGEDTYTVLNLKEPTIDQLSKFVTKIKTENPIEAMKSLISMISGVPLPVLSKVGTRDYYKAHDYLSAFITPPEEDDSVGNVEGSH